MMRSSEKFAFRLGRDLEASKSADSMSSSECVQKLHPLTSESASGLFACFAVEDGRFYNVVIGVVGSFRLKIRFLCWDVVR